MALCKSSSRRQLNAGKGNSAGKLCVFCLLFGLFWPLRPRRAIAKRLKAPDSLRSKRSQQKYVIRVKETLFSCRHGPSPSQEKGKREQEKTRQGATVGREGPIYVLLGFPPCNETPRLARRGERHRLSGLGGPQMLRTEVGTQLDWLLCHLYGKGEGTFPFAVERRLSRPSCLVCARL